MAGRFPIRWIIPLLLITLLGGLFSMRKLSDPDLGFHLKYGKWICENKTVPHKDHSTYTVPNHEYIDSHWLFQVALCGIYQITGYKGLTGLVIVLTLLLMLLNIAHARLSNGLPYITCAGLLLMLIIMEPTFGPHPELLSFLFISGTLIILDQYYYRKKNLLFLLPVIQLLWCNLHGLFILGIVIGGAYFISLLIRDRKIDKTFLFWYLLSILICLANPYFLKGFLFPFELLTRFDPGNIFNQHIQEFIPFLKQPRFVLRDYLFIGVLATTYLFMLLPGYNRSAHELILIPVFTILAFASIRNIPLFILIAIPVWIKGASLLTFRPGKKTECGLVISFIVIPLLLIPGVLTDRWYKANHAINRTGFGLDENRQPVGVAEFLDSHRLYGRVLNSIGYGGWFSWRLEQPVFIDGRLEVMREELYQEVVDSWDGGLLKLIWKYQPDIIAYNYHAYYPWTPQLAGMSNWRLVYLDESAAAFVRDGYADTIPTVDPLRVGIDDEKGSKARFIAGLTPVTTSRENLLAIKLYNSGNERIRREDFEGALSDFSKALELEPDYIKALNNRAILQATVFKNFPAAHSDFRKILTIDSGFSDAWLGRGTAFFLQNKIDSACNSWQKASRLGNAKALQLLSTHCNSK